MNKKEGEAFASPSFLIYSIMTAYALFIAQCRNRDGQGRLTTVEQVDDRPADWRALIK